MQSAEPFFMKETGNLTLCHCEEVFPKPVARHEAISISQVHGRDCFVPRNDGKMASQVHGRDCFVPTDDETAHSVEYQQDEKGIFSPKKAHFNRFFFRTLVICNPLLP